MKTDEDGMKTRMKIKMKIVGNVYSSKIKYAYKNTVQIVLYTVSYDRNKVSYIGGSLVEAWRKLGGSLAIGAIPTCI